MGIDTHLQFQSWQAQAWGTTAGQAFGQARVQLRDSASMDDVEEQLRIPGITWPSRKCTPTATHLQQAQKRRKR